MLYTFYRITINNENYIGSTKDFNQRKGTHKSNCYNKNTACYNNRLYTYIRDHGGWDYCEMCPIEELECDTKTQALIREEFWRRDYKALLNVIQAHRTKEELVKQQKSHNDINNPKRKLNILTCCCGSSYESCRLLQHKSSKKHQKYMVDDPPIEIIIN